MLLNWVITKGQNLECGSSRSLRLLYINSVQSKMKMICSSANQKTCWDAQMTDSFIFMFQLPFLFFGIFYHPHIKLRCFLHNRFFDVIVRALFCFIIPFDCKSPLLLSPVFQLGIFGLSCSLIAFFTQSNL